MPVTPVPTEPTWLQRAFGSPEDLALWILYGGGSVSAVVTVHNAANGLLERIFPWFRRQRGRGTTIIQETGPGSVQESDRD